MLEVYGQLIRAQLQISATDLSPTATGLIYFNTTTGIKWHNGTAWKIAADLDSSQTLLNKLISSTGLVTGALTLPAGTQAERPGSPVVGMVRYNSSTGSFEGYANATWSGIGGGGTTDIITQNGHGFNLGDVLYLNGSTYTKAIATAANTAEVVGMVSRIISVNQFELTLSGEVSGLSSLTAGEVYFLSTSVAGQTTINEPTVVGHVSLPVGIASSATTMYVAPKRGSVIGSSNARTQISLANNTTNTVQNVSSYDAGELTGWVSISATTPLRFYVSAKFSKNGANNDYNLNYQTVGDNPPTGFIIQVTAAGIIQAVLPNIAGFTSANINYALNASAIGTSFPLTVQPSSILVSNTIDQYAANTRLGLMQYSHGTTYNGGIAPTITLAAGGGTLTTVVYSSLIPYQISDGTWRMRFNINVALSATARTSIELAINGVSYPSSNISFSGGFLGASSSAIAFTSTTNLVLNYASATAVAHILSGDVPLSAKPTWAY